MLSSSASWAGCCCARVTSVARTIGQTNANPCLFTLSDRHLHHQSADPLRCIHRPEVRVAQAAGEVEVAQWDGSSVHPLTFILLDSVRTLTLESVSQCGFLE